METQRVRIVSPRNTYGTKCHIDEKEVQHVHRVDFHIAVGEIPTFTFETIGLPDIDMAGDVQFRFTPETVQQAAVVLQNEFKRNQESRKALIASIQSAIKDAPEESWSWDMAELIADRIIGLEK